MLVTRALPQNGGGDTTEAAATETAAEKAKAAAAAAAAKAADTSVRIPQGGQIYVSEVMFAGGGTLPQWIEISNGSRTEQVNLSGWTLTVENDSADADVSVGAKAVFTIPEGTQIDPSGQNDTPSTDSRCHRTRDVATLTGSEGRRSGDQPLDVTSSLNYCGWIFSKRRYSLLSDVAFKITLAPPDSRT